MSRLILLSTNNNKNDYELNKNTDPLQFVNGNGVASAVFHFKEDHLVVKLKALINGDANTPDPFVYLYNQGQQMLDRPLSDETPESILADMTKIAEQYFANTI